jgi:hypothetical protein
MNDVSRLNPNYYQLHTLFSALYPFFTFRIFAHNQTPVAVAVALAEDFLKCILGTLFKLTMGPKGEMLEYENLFQLLASKIDLMRSIPIGSFVSERIEDGSYIEKLVNMKVMSANRPPTILYLLEVGRGLQKRLHSGRSKGYVFRALSIQAMALKIAHALELAETQSVVALQNYIDKLKSESGSKKGSKAARAIVGSPEFELIEALLGNIGDEHPKMMKVREIVEQQISTKANSKVMVFTNYRDSCEAVAKYRRIAGQDQA